MNTFSILWCYPDKSLVLPILGDIYIVLRIRVWSFRPFWSALYAPFAPIFSVSELRCKITAFYPCGQYRILLKSHPSVSPEIGSCMAVSAVNDGIIAYSDLDIA